MYHYEAQVLRIIDGDTFEAMVDLGFKSYTKLKFRLSGIDTPEIYRPSCDAELEHGKAATEYLKELIEGKMVLISTHKLKQELYNRWGADVCLKDGQDIATLMKRAGYEKKESY